MNARMRMLTLVAALALLLMSVQAASAKGTFDKVTVQFPNSDQPVEVSDPALLNFWSFSDFVDGTKEAPSVVGAGYEVTRWYRAEDGTAVAWDRLVYYHTSPDNTDGRGWVYYDGLVNGSSEYDDKWYPSTRFADALMESVIYAEYSPNLTTRPTSTQTTSMGAVVVFTLALTLWLAQR